MKTLLISLFIFSLCISCIIFILYIVLFKKMIFLKQDLYYEKQSYNCLSSSYDGIREFKHDFSNIMQAISGYLITDDLDGLKKYYSSIFKDCEEIKQMSVFNREIFNNPAILSLIAEKYNSAKKFGIDFNIEVFTDLSKLNINTYELTRILGIFLDNSIEACQNLNNSKINVIISQDNQKKYDYIIIENTYDNSDTINTTKIFEKNYSTKPENTGIGLCKVKKIISKHKNLELKTDTYDNIFKHYLKIYK